MIIGPHGRTAKLFKWKWKTHLNRKEREIYKPFDW